MTRTTLMTTPGDDELDLLHAVAESSRLHLVEATRVHGEAGPDGFVTGYRVRLADEAGRQIERFVYVTTEPRGGDRDGVLRMRDESGDERAVWVYPNDPRLPALARAVVPSQAREVLESFGPGHVWAHDASGVGPPVGRESELTLVVAAYRPGKRAVVRATLGGLRAYLKVVPPGRAERIHARHEVWRAAGIPVPRPLGWTEQGIVGLAEQPGRAASEALDRADPDRLLDGIAALRRRIAQLPSNADARGSLGGRVDWYTRRTAMRDPELEPRLRSIRASVDRLLAETTAERVTIHGDLHLGQLFVDEHDPSRVAGVIDIDTAGTGDPADDDAALWAHLIATATHAAAHAATAGDLVRAERAETLADRARSRWSADGADGADRADRIAAIAATHLLGHALTGSLPAADAVARAEGLVQR
ncbi:aminoglycoside phosphotransferase family protein [Agromyces laixinhei]|uniref:aminoglycoside phosphotransferase family protein n=1 Tax=Agromyces laixinhei TaxID=2585717 RepID=UPI0012EE2643|nr:aminoglycoside phosphotransferase family protein [Agromyces laixinhei]